MESGTRRGAGVTATLRRRERLHRLLSVVAACGQIEVRRLVDATAPSDAPSTLERYEGYLRELVRMDLAWVHKGPRGVRIASATARGRRALARAQTHRSCDLEAFQDVIDKARVAERRRRDKERSAELARRRNNASLPALGAVVDISRPDPDRDGHSRHSSMTVERTYSNRTISGADESGTRVFLVWHEYHGVWLEICGQPNSEGLPCRRAHQKCSARHPCRKRFIDAQWP